MCARGDQHFGRKGNDKPGVLADGVFGVGQQRDSSESAFFFVHQEDLEQFSLLSNDKIEEIFRKNQSRDMTNYTGDDALIMSDFHRLMRYKTKYNKAVEKNDYKNASRYLLNCVNIIEKRMTTAGYKLMFGSEQNFFLAGSIDGFRIGDERGDEAITLNSLGSIGNDQLASPTTEIFKFFQQSTGEPMIEGEFFINWLLGRVI